MINRVNKVTTENSPISKVSKQPETAIFTSIESADRATTVKSQKRFQPPKKKPIEFKHM